MEPASGEPIKIGLMGLGVVGSAVAKALHDSREALSHQVGRPLELKRVLVRDPDKKRAYSPPPAVITTQVEDIVADPDIDIVVELMGGEKPALEYITQALQNGKHVVTANKEVVAKHGPMLKGLAEDHGVEVLYEASVGGGIPLMGPFKQGLLANRITAVHAIINGTTNYILSRMASEGVDLPEALSEAQHLGYAELVPSAGGKLGDCSVGRVDPSGAVAPAAA